MATGNEGYIRPFRYYYFVYPPMMAEEEDFDGNYGHYDSDDDDDDDDDLSRQKRSVYRQTSSTFYANPQHGSSYYYYPSYSTPSTHPVSSAAARGAYVGASTANNYHHNRHPVSSAAATGAYLGASSANNYRHPVSSAAARGAFLGARAGSRWKRSPFRYRRRHFYRPRYPAIRVGTAAYLGARAGSRYKRSAEPEPYYTTTHCNGYGACYTTRSGSPALRHAAPVVRVGTAAYVGATAGASRRFKRSPEPHYSYYYPSYYYPRPENVQRSI